MVGTLVAGVSGKCGRKCGRYDCCWKSHRGIMKAGGSLERTILPHQTSKEYKYEGQGWISASLSHYTDCVRHVRKRQGSFSIRIQPFNVLLLCVLLTCY